MSCMKPFLRMTFGTILAAALLTTFPSFLYAEIGNLLKILHIPPKKFVYSEALRISLKPSEPVETVKFFFLRPGFTDYQFRIMKLSEDGTYIYILDTSSLASLKISYFFEIKTESQLLRYPSNAPEEVIALEGTTIEPNIDKEVSPPAPSSERIAIKDRLPFQFNIDSSSSWEIATHGDAPSPFNQDKRFITDNNVRISKRYQKDGLAVNFFSNLAVSNSPLQDTDRVALTNVLLQANRDNHHVNVGDISIQGSKFTIDVAGRRGGEYKYTSGDFFFQVFDINSQQEQGWGSIVPESQANLYGGAAGLNAFNRQFSIKTVYLAGKDDPSKGQNVAGTDLVRRKGSVFSLSPEIRLFENKLKLFGEYAASKYDPDLSDNIGMKSDDAWRAGGEIGYLHFRFGAEYSLVGQDFDSIGNQYSTLFTPDRESYNIWAGYNSGPVMFSLKYLGEEDNVENDDQRPTSELNNITSSLTLLLTDRFTLNMSYQNSHQETHEEAGKGAELQEKRVDDYVVGFDYLFMASSSIHGGASLTQIDSDTDSEAVSDTLTTFLGASIFIGDRLSIFPEFSYSKTRYDLFDSETETYSGFLSGEYFILLDTLSVSTLSSYTRTESDKILSTDGLELDSEDIQLTGNLNYYLPFFSDVLKRSVLSLKGGYIRSNIGEEKSDAYSVAVQFDFSL